MLLCIINCMPWSRKGQRRLKPLNTWLGAKRATPIPHMHKVGCHHSAVFYGRTNDDGRHDDPHYHAFTRHGGTANHQPWEERPYVHQLTSWLHGWHRKAAAKVHYVHALARNGEIDAESVLEWTMVALVVSVIIAVVAAAC
jgi:hypothetical protein